jgi:hypothetical protein
MPKHLLCRTKPDGAWKDLGTDFLAAVSGEPEKVAQALTTALEDFEVSFEVRDVPDITETPPVTPANEIRS